MLGELEQAAPSAQVVVADMEAGLGTLSRMGAGLVDAVLVVTNPSVKALDVAHRAVTLIHERAIGPVLIVANRVQRSDDVEMIRHALLGAELLVIPEDRAIEDADRQALAPIDVAPTSPGLQAIMRLAERLMRGVGDDTP